MKTWLKVALALVLVWTLAGIVLHYVHASVPTLDSTARFLRAQEMASKSAADRQKAILKTADLLNRLSIEDREELRRERLTDAFFRSLTPEEQGQFLDLTLPTGFKQMMDAFNKMDSAKRKRIVDRAIHNMQQRRDQDGGPGPGLDDQNAQRIINQGLKSFYSEANAETKLDLSPFIDEVQHTLQSGGGGGHGGEPDRGGP